MKQTYLLQFFIIFSIFNTQGMNHRTPPQGKKWAHQYGKFVDKQHSFQAATYVDARAADAKLQEPLLDLRGSDLHSPEGSDTEFVEMTHEMGPDNQELPDPEHISLCRWLCCEPENRLTKNHMRTCVTRTKEWMIRFLPPLLIISSIAAATNNLLDNVYARVMAQLMFALAMTYSAKNIKLDKSNFHFQNLGLLMGKLLGIYLFGLASDSLDSFALEPYLGINLGWQLAAMFALFSTTTEHFLINRQEKRKEIVREIPIIISKQEFEAARIAFAQSAVEVIVNNPELFASFFTFHPEVDGKFKELSQMSCELQEKYLKENQHRFRTLLAMIINRIMPDIVEIDPSFLSPKSQRSMSVGTGTSRLPMEIGGTSLFFDDDGRQGQTDIATFPAQEECQLPLPIDEFLRQLKLHSHDIVNIWLDEINVRVKDHQRIVQLVTDADTVRTTVEVG